MNDVNRNRGLSVIELVSAAAILSIAALMIIGAFFGAANLERRIKENNMCKTAVQSIYEEAKATGAVAFCSEHHIKAVSDIRFEGVIENKLYSVNVLFEKLVDRPLFRCVITPKENSEDGISFEFLCVG